jgi:hypothetical protein
MSHPTKELIRQSAEPRADLEPLADFEASRRPIVLSYCTWVCDDERAEEAVDAAFERLERELDAAEARGAEPIRIDRLLREATRDAAASRVEPIEGRASLVRRLGGRGQTCSLMPELLAARAAGRLSAGDRERVARHVKRCWSCRGLERRHAEAERAYEAFLRAGVAEGEAPAVPTAAPDEPLHAAPAEAAPEAAADGPVKEAAPPAAPVSPEPVAAQPEPLAAPEPLRAERTPTRAASPSGRSPWVRRSAIGVVLAGLVAAVAIAVTSLSGGSDDPPAADRAPAREAAAPAPPPAERPQPTAAERADARLDSLGDRMLGPGATGPDVRALQRLLGVPRTGAYDDATTQAVLTFQTANGLNPDGNAGPETKRLIARRPPAAAN